MTTLQTNQERFLSAHGLPSARTEHIIGSGCSRDVYTLHDEPAYVLKRAAVCNCGERSYSGRILWCGNLTEYKVWETARGTSAERHLPKVYALSDDHRYLLAERVLPNTWGDDPTHAVKDTFRSLGIVVLDDHSGNKGRRDRPGDPIRDSVILDSGHFVFQGVDNLCQFLSAPYRQSLESIRV